MVHQLGLAPEQLLHLVLGLDQGRFQVHAALSSHAGGFGEIRLGDDLGAVPRGHLIGNGLQIPFEGFVQVEVHHVLRLPGREVGRGIGKS